MKNILHVNAVCDIGCKKPSNEDMILLHGPQPSSSKNKEGSTLVKMFRDGKEKAVFDAKDRVIIAVADGVGGLNKGEVASEHVLKSLIEILSNIPGDLTNEELCSVFETFCRETHARLSKEMGSTIVGLFLYNGKLFRYHAGDSRIYRLRRGDLERLTVDHSLRESGGQKNAPSNIITNSIGGGTSAFLEFAEIELPFFINDIYLLSSDGMHDLLSLEEIQSVLNKPNAAELLTDMSKEKGGKDNISVVTINIKEK